MAEIVYRSFASGEVSPDLWYKSDMNSYLTGLRTCRNMIVRKTSGISRRDGTKFVVRTKYNDRPTRLLPFEFQLGDVLAIEFGHEYFRFIRYGQLVTSLTSERTISSVSPGPVKTYTTSANHDLSVSDDVRLQIGTPSGLNTYWAKVSNVISATEFQVEPETDFDPSDFLQGRVRKPVEVAHPFQEQDLFLVNYTQVGNIITLVHPSYGVFELTRTSSLNDTWTFNQNILQPNPYKPVNLDISKVPGNNGNYSYVYLITSVDVNGSESFPQYPIITLTGPLVDGASVISLVSKIDPNTASTFISLEMFAPATTAQIVGFRIYRQENPRGLTPMVPGFMPVPNTYSNFGFIAEIDATMDIGSGRATAQFVDDGSYIPDFSSTPSRPTIIYGEEIEMDYDGTNASTFDLHNLHPSAVSVSKERIYFAGSFKYPESVWGSAVSEYGNFTAKDPGGAIASDAVSIPRISENFGRIKHLLDYKRLIVFADFGEVVLRGEDEYGAVSAVGLPNPDKISTNGIGNVRPLIVDKSVLYVQARNGSIRDMFLEMAVDGYQGDEVSIMSQHLFADNEIVDWSFQRTEHPIVWAVRDDGVVIGFTYNPSQAMRAFHRHDFYNGKAKSVITLSESQSDMTYVIVERVIDGSVVQYIERFDTVEKHDLRQMNFMDCSIVTTEILPDKNILAPEFILTQTSGWEYGEDLNLNSDSPLFDSGYVGKEIHMYQEGYPVLKLRITSFVDSSNLTVRADRDVTPEYQVGIRTHGVAVNEIRNLWHLEGEDVCVVGDGLIYGSPLNDAYPKITVSGGRVVLPNYHVVIRVGLPFVSDVETLDFDTAERVNSYSNKPMCVTSVGARVKSTAQFYAGIAMPTGPDYLQGLRELKVRQYENYPDHLKLATGTVEIAVEGRHEIGGRVFIRQVDPYPLNIMTLFPNIITLS